MTWPSAFSRANGLWVRELPVFRITLGLKVIASERGLLYYCIITVSSLSSNTSVEHDLCPHRVEVRIRAPPRNRTLHKMPAYAQLGNRFYQQHYHRAPSTFVQRSSSVAPRPYPWAVWSDSDQLRSTSHWSSVPLSGNPTALAVNYPEALFAATNRSTEQHFAKLLVGSLNIPRVASASNNAVHITGRVGSNHGELCVRIEAAAGEIESIISIVKSYANPNADSFSYGAA